MTVDPSLDDKTRTRRRLPGKADGDPAGGGGTRAACALMTARNSSSRTGGLNRKEGIVLRADAIPCFFTRTGKEGKNLLMSESIY